MKYAIGIDIGGTNTKLGAVDDKGSVLKRHEFKTTDYDNFASYMEGLERAISFLTADTDGEWPRGWALAPPTATITRAP